jgi:DNA invertase Pin-like site-specific DNA recombinase
MLDNLAPGDVLTVARLDRLASSTFDPVRYRHADCGRQVAIPTLAEPWADTGTSTGRLMIAVLGGLADVERDLIRTRTAEGRSRAKAQGKQADPLPSHRRSRKRPPDGACRARRSTNSPAATM